MHSFTSAKIRNGRTHDNLNNFQVDEGTDLEKRLKEMIFISRFMGATSASLVSANVKLLLDEPVDPQDSVNELRHIMYAFAISDEDRCAFEKRFNTRLCDLWGLTETLGATTLSPVFRKSRSDSIGVVRPGNEMLVVDEQGGELPPGQEGELIVKGVPGRTLMRCYFNDQELTSRKMRDGWFFTGDIGSMDADGYFYFSEKNYS